MGYAPKPIIPGGAAPQINIVNGVPKLNCNVGDYKISIKNEVPKLEYIGGEYSTITENGVPKLVRNKWEK